MKARLTGTKYRGGVRSTSARRRVSVRPCCISNHPSKIVAGTGTSAKQNLLSSKPHTTQSETMAVWLHRNLVRMQLSWHGSSYLGQSGCIETICQVLEKHNRTNTWQVLDSCVVEQCFSALALYVHRRPEVRYTVCPHTCTHERKGWSRHPFRCLRVFFTGELRELVCTLERVRGRRTCQRRRILLKKQVSG